MAIELNHTIVPVRDKEESARFWEKIFGFEHQEPLGHFQPVHIASQSLSLDLDDRKEVEHHHYAFKVSEPEFDEIFGRIKEADLCTAADRGAPPTWRRTPGTAGAASISGTPTDTCWSCSRTTTPDARFPSSSRT